MRVPMKQAATEAEPIREMLSNSSLGCCVVVMNRLTPAGFLLVRDAFSAAAKALRALNPEDVTTEL
jgi:hypothetical protein